MTGRIFTADHRVYDFTEPISWSVTNTGGVPCDAWSMQLVYTPEMAPVLKLAAGFAAIENGVTVLRGIVDEYEIEIGASGASATLCGRGYAARLLDNESRAMTYQDATLEEIVRAHAAPYGIPLGKIASVRATAPYVVAAGTSQWKVLDDFCRTFGGFSPRFSKEGTLIAAPEEREGKTIVIGADDPVLRLSLREDHYGVLTEALVIDKRQNKSYSVKNQAMIDKGGQCRRVIYTPGKSTWSAMRFTGEYQIAQSRKNEHTVELTLPGSFRAFPGQRVRLDLDAWGVCGAYRVAEAQNTLSPGAGAQMKWTLKGDE